MQRLILIDLMPKKYKYSGNPHNYLFSVLICTYDEVRKLSPKKNKMLKKQRHLENDISLSAKTRMALIALLRLILSSNQSILCLIMPPIC